MADAGPTRAMSPRPAPRSLCRAHWRTERSLTERSLSLKVFLGADADGGSAEPMDRDGDSDRDSQRCDVSVVDYAALGGTPAKLRSVFRREFLGKRPVIVRGYRAPAERSVHG